MINKRERISVFQVIRIDYWCFLITLMQCERNSKLGVLIREYIWKIKMKIALKPKSNTNFVTINFYKCDAYFGMVLLIL